MKESTIDFFFGDKGILEPGNTQYFVGSGWQGIGNISVPKKHFLFNTSRIPH